MLIRAFRVTDRLGNAALRVGAWLAMALIGQVTELRRALVGVAAATASVIA